MPAPLIRCSPPIQSSRSGLIGFFTSTGTSCPTSASAISCMAKGLATVRAPIQRMSMPCSSAAFTCAAVATSVVTSMPNCFCTRCSHFNPGSPTPSNPPGFVRGFHMPARKILMPLLASCVAVVITCSSVSAEQGPAIVRGRVVISIPGRLRGRRSSSILFLRFRVV